MPYGKTDRSREEAWNKLPEEGLWYCGHSVPLRRVPDLE